MHRSDDNYHAAYQRGADDRNFNSREVPVDCPRYSDHRAHDRWSRLHSVGNGAHQSIKIPSFTGKEDWIVWSARFEAIANRYRWDDEDKLDQLLPRLEGQASEFVFSQLPPRVLTSYQHLVAELNSRYRVIHTARSYAAKFSKRSQKYGEMAEDFAADLKNVVRQRTRVQRYEDQE